RRGRTLPVAADRRREGIATRRGLPSQPRRKTLDRSRAARFHGGMSGIPSIIPFGVDSYPANAAGGEAMAFPHIPAGAADGKTLRMNAQRFALPAAPQDL